MGNTTCQSNKRLSLVGKEVKESENLFDKQIVEEYRNLFKSKTYASNLFGQNKVNVDIKKRRFVKWYKMSYMEEVEPSEEFSLVSTNDKSRSRRNSGNVNSLFSYNNGSFILVDNNEARKIRKSRQRENSGVNREPSEFSSPIIPKRTNNPKQAKSSKNNPSCVNFEIKEIRINPENGIRQYFKKNKLLFLERVSKGPPEVFRHLAWEVVLNIPELKLEDTYNLAMIKVLDEEIESQIKKDLDRTMTAFKTYDSPSTRILLFNILKALAINDPELGYCQGTNIIAGFILLVTSCDEFDAYYMTSAIFSSTFSKNIGLRGFFTNKFPKLTYFVDLALRHIFAYYPKIQKHFKTIEFHSEAWLQKWFHTLFILSFPMEFTIRIWDNIIVYGLDFIIKVTLAIVKLYEKTILSHKDAFDLMEDLYRIFQTNGFTDFELLIEQAKKVKLDYKLILAARRHFEERFNVKLPSIDKDYDVFLKSSDELEKEIKVLDEESFNSTVEVRESSFLDLNDLEESFSVPIELASGRNSIENKMAKYNFGNLMQGKFNSRHNN